VKGADELSIGLHADSQLDTLAAFDEITALSVAGDRWISGLLDVRKATEAIVPLLSVAVNQHHSELGWLTVDEHSADIPGWFTSHAEGKSFRLAVSPGTVALSTIDTNKAEKAVQRAYDAHSTLIDVAAAWVDESTGEIDPSFVFEESEKKGSEVTKWSKRSRMRMVRAVAELDYSDWKISDGALAMVTLTLPGDWVALAPDGKTFKKLVEKLRKRWLRAVGGWRCLWKLEFQERGAPHMHLLMRVPAMVGTQTFEQWLSEAWAGCCGASPVIDGVDRWGRPSSEYSRHLSAGTGVDFSGKKFSDPRRIALYFLGHSMKGPDGKEYQHIVPEEWRGAGKGPGRFWGFSGFEKAVVELEISHADFAVLARQFRKLQRARDWKATLVRRRGKAEAGHWVSAVDHRWSKYSKATRAMGAGGSVLGGWVLLNDALPVIGNYARWLESR
jgi:hypothetical protein